MLRLFVTSSQICALYMSVYAKKTHKQGYKDVLIIDYTKKKKALVEVIKRASGIHNWTEVIDLSINVDNESNTKPSFRKRVTRKLKVLPIIQPLYNAMFILFFKKHTNYQFNLLKNNLSRYLGLSEKVELGLLTQTGLNHSLVRLFPQAKINYFEHGSGDYLLISGKEFSNSNFYCVFSESFLRFTQKRNIPVVVRDYITSEDYKNACTTIASLYTDELNIQQYVGNKKIVLFLMDAAEIYTPPKIFWTDYIKKCISYIDHPQEYRFLLKPHPSQSNDVIEITENFFRESGLDFVMLKDPYFVNSGIEIFYHQIHDQVSHVFSTFSSAIFYMAHFYPKNDKYYYLYNFVKPYFNNGPQQFLEIYNGLDDYFNEVLNEGNLIRI